MRASKASQAIRFTLFRTVLPVMATILLFIASISFLILPIIEDALLDSKREMIKELTYTVWSLVEDYYRRYELGEFSEDEARARAVDRVREIRYGVENKDYFWINDLEPTMVMHPYRLDLEGTNLSTFTDINGKYLFNEFVDIALTQSEGYVDYFWQWQDNPYRIAPKLSYVKTFEPWEWVIGTGVYIEDVQIRIGLVTQRMNQAFAGILVILGGISSYIVWNSERAERRRTQAEFALQESEKRLSIIFNSAFQFISILDAKGQLLKVNQTALDFIDLEHSAVENKLFWETPWWTGTRESQKLLKDAIERAQNGEFVRFEAENFGRRGKVITVDVSLKPLLDSRDKVYQILAEGRDVTDRIMAESALEESEKRFAEFMAHLPAIAFMKDRFGRYIYTNRAFEIHNKLPFGNRLGKSDYELFPSEIAKVFTQNDRKVFETGETNEFIEHYLDDDGEERVYLSIKFPIMNKNQISAIGGVAVEITDRINVETELRQLRNLLQNIIDSMPSMLIGVNKSMHITHWNLEAERFTGVLAEAALGKSLGTVYPLIKPKINIIQEAIDKQKSFKDVRIIVNLDNQIRHMELTVYPLIANGMEGAVIRIDDISERIHLEEMMTQSEKMLTVGGLAAGMAHEINNPLAGILQNVQVLRNRVSKGLPKNQIIAEDLDLDFEKLQAYLIRRGIFEMLDAISDSGQRAAQIVDNMLSFSRKSESKLAPYDLADLLDKTVSLAAKDYDLKKKYDFKRIRINREYDATTPKVPCEGSKIQQVFLNLLKNSAQALSENIEIGREPAITLRVFEDDKWVRMEIEDNGPGMDERTRKRVFEPFFTTKKVGVGTGLGLSVSYFIIVDNHHGEIKVESDIGKGTKFIIRLPIEVV